MFKIYSSSAGSGKTYTLTKEYLKLALDPKQDDRYFKHILAITFTNAAANEMKERILKELRAFADGTDSPLLTDLVAELYGHAAGSDASETARREVCLKAAQVFRAILHNYSDFSVTTIDSFMQRLVTAFTDELGLPYSFEVEMETDEVFELAIDNLIEKAGTEEMEEITDILSDYFTETAKDGDNWNQLPERLKEFGKNLTSDQYYEAVNRVQELSPADIRKIRQQILTHNHTYEADILRLAQQAWKRITDTGLSEEDFKGKKNSIAAFFKTICQKDLHKEPTATHRKTVDTQDWYLANTPLPIQGLIDGMVDELCACFSQIDTLRATCQQAYALYECLLPHLQKLALLKQIRLEFDALLRQDGRVHISEFNKKIQSIVASEPVPFLYERLGTKYFHILIDEFQDTSKLQFANLLPLIENALAFQHFNLAVGDGKQAIYRFRGGDMDQIVALHRQDLGQLRLAHGSGWTAERIGSLDGQLESQVLGTNWRSARPIVEFNNQFFEFVARRYDGEHGKIAEVFDTGRLFHQEPSLRARPEGHIQLDFVAKTEEMDLTAVMLAKTMAHIEAACSEGYRYGDMAILCRRKKDAKAIANELNAHGIPLVSADSLSLQFSDPVKWLVTVMQLLNRPDQKLFRYEVLYLFCRFIQGVFPDDKQTEELRIIAESDVSAVYDYLTNHGYPLDDVALRQLNVYELVEKLAWQFRLFDKAENSPFLFRFLDEVLTFCQRQSGHLADFLTYWEVAQEKVSVGEGESQDAISIQTIHKAKGLEYPVVIIPFANWQVTLSNDHTLWLDLEGVPAPALELAGADGGRIRLETAPVTNGKELKNTPEAITRQLDNEKTRTFIENMNLLYVAFTRATDRMYIISEQKDFSKGQTHNTVAYWLHAYLNSDTALQCGWEEGRSTYVLSDCHQAFSKPRKHPDGEEIQLEKIISGERHRDLQLRRQAERVFDVQTFEKTREWDRKVCAALSLIKGPDCIDKTLRRLVSEGIVRIAECEDLRQSLGQIIRHPDLRDLFNPRLRIDTDRSILSRQRPQQAPHRVVHRPDGSLVLVQYESAPVDNAAPSGGSLRYFNNLYREMGYPEVEGRLVRLGQPLQVIWVR
ncbi:UvrD-helicase domain-containing protein [Nibrella saemangeumensis]|uniref:DNA 3'-5' helicase n=1 Tax=Nibrella saemangeumensis TaxID=1084526 RepID=A0ABP8NP40_9BACT